MKKNLVEIFNRHQRIRAIRGITFCLFLILFGCIPPEKKTTQVEVDLSGDPIQMQILELGYRQQLDSLISYFNHPNATYRYLAVSVFSSFQTESVVDSLINRLDDPVPEVVQAAAHALGQHRKSKAEKPLISHFMTVDSSGSWLGSNQAILEAVGKLGSEEAHDHIATVSTYLPVDSLLILGQSRALFNFATRKITNKKGIRKSLELLNADKYTTITRMYAAHYLSRSEQEDLSEFADTLLVQVKFERNIEVLVPLIRAVSKTGVPQVYHYLTGLLDNASDDRIKVAIVEALPRFPDFAKNTHQLAIRKIPLESIKVAQSFCDLLYQHGSSNYGRLYWQMARSQQLSPDISLRLYAVAFHYMPLWHEKRMALMRYELYQSYLNTEDLYYRSRLIETLGENIDNIQFVSDSLLHRVEHPVLHTALARAYGKYLNAEIIPLLGNKKRVALLDSISQGVDELLETQNVGSWSVLAESIRKPAFRDSIWIAKLNGKKQQLELPREYEAYLELDKTIAYLSNEIFENDRPPLTKKTIKLDSTLMDNRAVVKTSAGTFIIDLLFDQAPFTVMNFIELSREGYYNNKRFHRVVNNFVIQGGCSIGDGYGSMDYVISSEVNKAYYEETGYVGMASAGLHTESAQWFVNLLPTPHLNGRYTIFGKVISGTQVLQNIKLGDKIISIDIIN